MKTTILKISVLLFVLVIIGCNNSKELKDGNVTDTFLTKLQSAPSDIHVKGAFPGWLLTKINEIETNHSKDIAIVKVEIFQGEWNEQIVYFIRHNLSSCLFCEVYYENGEKIVYTWDNFGTTSKSWKLIYTYGNGYLW